MIFRESLPPLWWLGAALLVAGNVIIGRREETEPSKDGEDSAVQTAEGNYTDEDDALLNRGSVELDESLDSDRNKTAVEEDVLQLDLDEGEENLDI